MAVFVLSHTFLHTTHINSSTMHSLYWKVIVRCIVFGMIVINCSIASALCRGFFYFEMLCMKHLSHIINHKWLCHHMPCHLFGENFFAFDIRRFPFTRSDMHTPYGNRAQEPNRNVRKSSGMKVLYVKMVLVKQWYGEVNWLKGWG